MRNYTLLFPKENIIVGCDLDLFQSGKGQWEVMGGEKKISVVEMQRNNIRCTWVSFSLLGSVFILIQGGSRVNKGDCV